jgi:cytochrome c
MPAVSEGTSVTQKKYPKTYLGLGAVTVTAALLLSACGPSAPPTPAEAPPPIATQEAAAPSIAPAAAPSVTAAASATPALAAKAPSAKPASTTAAAATPAPASGNGLPAPYDVADLDNGKKVFNQCSACHKIAAGAGNGLGPNLHGVFGTKAGDVPGFAFSDPLKASGIVWDYAAMDKWLTSPAAMVPGNRMTFIGVRKPEDRRDVIAYLKIESSK